MSEKKEAKVVRATDVLSRNEILEVSDTFFEFPDINVQSNFNVAGKDPFFRPSNKSDIKTTRDFDFLLKKNSEIDLKKELQSTSPGISTGYKIGDIDLNFPGGAISIIAAPTSHGKTTALINFALGALEKNTNQSMYFFTYEEGGASILSLFINTWVSKKLSGSGVVKTLSKNNRRSIESYFRDNTNEFISKDLCNLFGSHKAEFFQDFIDTGRLRVFYSDMTTDQLCKAIYFIKSHQSNVRLIVIDYMQLLKLPNSKNSRQEELKKICLMLKDCAIETGLPIVLAAQFNRTVTTEADLSPVNIGEAGDIERIASLIIGMFNRTFDQMTRDGNTSKNGEKIPRKNEVYFEILKGRGVGNGHHEVMDFNGNACTLKNRPKQASPFG